MSSIAPIAAINVPFTVSADSRDRVRWLAARGEGIGASEVATVLGISPFESPYHLACVKTKRIAPDNLDDNERVFWGLMLEDAIIHGYARRTSRVVVPFGLSLRSTIYPWLFATPDALVSESASDAAELIECVEVLRQDPAHSVALQSIAEALATQWCPLQIKNIGFGSAEHWTNGVPDYYVAQCQSEAIVCGSRKCVGAALVAGQKLVWDEVERTELSDRRIVHFTREFWSACTRGELPPIDGSDSTRDAIVAQFPRENPETFCHLGAEWFEKAEVLAEQKALIKQAEKRVAEIENELRAQIGDAPVALLPDGSGWSYRTQHRKQFVTKASSFRTLRRMTKKADDE